MHELQQLDGELDVADAAGAELELVRRLRPRGMCSVTRSRMRCTAVDEVLPRRARPDLRLHGVARSASPSSEVAGDRARLQQRLELPALRPAVVVRQVGFERAHERAVLALRAQVRIDLPQRRLDLELVDAAHRLHGEPGRDVDGARSLRSTPLIAGLRDEDHVDVAHVVELAGAGLAHADDREPGGGDLGLAETARRPRRRRDAACERRERRLERRAGAIREPSRRRRPRRRRRAQQVVRGDPRQQPPVAHPQERTATRWPRPVRGEPSRRRRVSEHAQLVRRRQRAPAPSELRELLRVAQVEVGEPGRAPSSAQISPACRGGVGWSTPAVTAAASRSRSSTEQPQRLVGVGGAGGQRRQRIGRRRPAS